ncbi:MAG: redoxin domain-containing protein [Bacteroidetes bacterium]|nr:redoxin domain-containing protein [Bacteroidota bacterium]
MKKLIFFFLLVASAALDAQNVCSINGEIRNNGGKKVYLSGYYGEKVKLIDSATCDPAGRFVFSLKPSTSPGLYKIFSGKDRSLDLVLNRENVEFTTNETMQSDSTTFKGSAENNLYYFFQGADRKIQTKLELLVPLLDFYPEQDVFFLQAAAEYERLQLSEKQMIDSLSRVYPGSFAVRMFKLQQTPFLSANLGKEGRLAYLKQHFLDTADFSDTLLLKSPAWANKAISYLSFYSNNKYSQKQLESEFIKAVTVMLSKASVNAEVYKFLLDYFVGGFDKYHFDAVITYIADNFQDPFSCEDQARKTQLQKKLENFKKISIGKIAPDIVVPDPKGKPIRLSEIKSEYTLLVFWSSECGHCVQMMPQLKELYDKQKPKRWEVMTVSIDTSRTEWATFLREQKLSWLNGSELKGFNSVSADEYNIFATPTMFLLDREKKILAKPISYRELEQALRENNLL